MPERRKRRRRRIVRNGTLKYNNNPSNQQRQLSRRSRSRSPSRSPLLISPSSIRSNNSSRHSRSSSGISSNRSRSRSTSSNRSISTTSSHGVVDFTSKDRNYFIEYIKDPDRYTNVDEAKKEYAISQVQTMHFDPNYEYTFHWKNKNRYNQGIDRIQTFFSFGDINDDDL